MSVPIVSAAKVRRAQQPAGRHLGVAAPVAAAPPRDRGPHALAGPLRSESTSARIQTQRQTAAGRRAAARRGRGRDRSRPPRRPCRRGNRADRGAAAAGTSARRCGRARSSFMTSPPSAAGRRGARPASALPAAAPPRLPPAGPFGDAVVVAPLVVGVRRRAARGGLDQPVLDHARERAIHRADVGHRRVAALLDVQDDPVAVPLAGGEAEQDVELDGPESRRSSVARRSRSIPMVILCVPHICTTHTYDVKFRLSRICGAGGDGVRASVKECRD